MSREEAKKQHREWWAEIRRGYAESEERSRIAGRLPSLLNSQQLTELVQRIEKYGFDSVCDGSTNRTGQLSHSA